MAAALRSLIAVLVTVVTLIGGSFRPLPVLSPSPLRAQLVVDRASDDSDQGTLERGRAAVQARATKPARPHGSDGVSSTFSASSSSRLVVAQRSFDATSIAPPAFEPRQPRVRSHVTNMVFLI